MFALATLVSVGQGHAAMLPLLYREAVPSTAMGFGSSGAFSHVPVKVTMTGAVVNVVTVGPWTVMDTVPWGLPWFVG